MLLEKKKEKEGRVCFQRDGPVHPSYARFVPTESEKSEGGKTETVLGLFCFEIADQGSG